MLQPQSIDRTIDRIVREEWGRILASLTKSLGDIQLAEDVLQDAIVAAMDTWAARGIPKVPAAWLLTTARRKALDRIRRDRNFASKRAELAILTELEAVPGDTGGAEMIPDKRLEMIFTCCHPALEDKTSLALTLRTLGGLTTEEIAAAFLDSRAAMAQRLTRAKKKIALAGIPYAIPQAEDLPGRLSMVLGVIYLIFNEGYATRTGAHPVRADLTDEAIRLGRIMHQLMPCEAEVAGLLALMLLHDARRASRVAEAGAMIPLEDQNRARWDRALIAEGDDILRTALTKGRIGPYQLQAAISAVHAHAPSWDETDWPQIVALYDLLYQMQPSAVVQVNRAVAVSYARSVNEGLALLADADSGEMRRYQPYHAARADFLARAGDAAAARAAFETAIALSDNRAEHEFLRGKMSALKR